MSKKKYVYYRLLLTGIVTMAICLLLCWNHFHGGVPSHHILAREDLPSFSNWWGGLILPLLTWLLLYRIQWRIERSNADGVTGAAFPASVFYGFVAALAFGILIAVFFTAGYTDIPGYMMLGIFVLALFLPVYRAECYLGFVIGMTYTFGAVLPTGIGLLLVLITAILYLYIRPVIVYLISKFIKIAARGK